MKFKKICASLVALLILLSGCISVFATPDDTSAGDNTSDYDTSSQYTPEPDPEPTPEPEPEPEPTPEPDYNTDDYPQDDYQEPIYDEYYFGDNTSETYENYDNYSSYSYIAEDGNAEYVSSSTEEDSSLLYDSNGDISTSALSEKDWEMALNFDQTANMGSDFSMIKNNKSGKDQNYSIWMLYIGIALIAGAAVIITVIIVKSKKQKEAAGFQDSVSLSSTSTIKKRHRYKGDTLEIDLPKNSSKKNKK